MSLKIYYFSGTGNSLAVARELKNVLNEKGSIVPLAILKNEETVQVDTDILGFVFPVYFMDIPNIVKSFIGKLTFKTNPYIFAIATCNGISGLSLFELNKCLVGKGKVLSSGFVIDMPGNALVTPQEIEIKRLQNYKSKVIEISNFINNRIINKIEGEDNFMSYMKSYICKLIGKNFYITPKNVLSTSECNCCGICEKVCPLNNIRIENKRPQWGKDCSSCLACYHWCPQKAVTGGIMLRKRSRYHHPEVSVLDMEMKTKMEKYN